MEIKSKVKWCCICNRPMNPDRKESYHESCDKIRTWNAKHKIRKYPEHDCFIFDSLRYHQVAQNMNAKGLAYNQKGFCYIALQTIQNECIGMTEIDTLKHYMRTISHEIIHKTLYELESDLTSFRYDCIWIKIKLNGYEGIRLDYTKEILQRLHSDYIKRSKDMLKRR